MNAAGIDAGSCCFRLVAHGPLLDQADSLDVHRSRRDHVAAMEKALAEAMQAAGYQLLNRVACLKPLDPVAFAPVRTAFAAHFSLLR